MSRRATSSVPLHPLLAERWSPRSFDPAHEVTDRQLTALLEAARWSASSHNGQPWRFLVGRRGDETYKAVYDTLIAWNQMWAGNASLLLVAVAAERLEGGTPAPTAAYETGLATSQLTLQAQAEGLYVHQMGGFSTERLIASFGIPDGFRPLAVIAVGALADAALLPNEQLRARETATRKRQPLEQISFAGSWGTPLNVGGEQAS